MYVHAHWTTKRQATSPALRVPNPPFVVGAGEEVLEDLALRQHRVTAHAVHEALQLVHPVLDELLLVATCGKANMSIFNQNSRGV